MPAVANSATRLEPHQAGGWVFGRWGGSRLTAGVTDRRVDAATVLGALDSTLTLVQAEQVHGASLAMMGRLAAGTSAVAGCDALMTDQPGMALLIRTADCLPVFVADPGRGVVGIAHAGWRGLAQRLPQRLIAAFRHRYQSRLDGLIAAIGPAIHGCCYEVGPEFTALFGRFVHTRGGRRTCDLIAAAMAQLRDAGLRADRITESGRCTACEPQSWYSVRREGDRAGRLTSFIWWR